MGQRTFLLLPLVIVALASPTRAQEADNAPFEDPWLDQLVGAWTMTGHVMGDSVEYDAEAEWVLGHQFLRLQMRDVQSPPEYEAHVYIGYIPGEEEYVAHWLDTSGGQPSTTLGYGNRQSDTLAFRFEYPDGPFRTTFERREDGLWLVRMRSQAESGEWRSFADFRMRRRPDR